MMMAPRGRVILHNQSFTKEKAINRHQYSGIERGSLENRNNSYLQERSWNIISFQSLFIIIILRVY